MTSFMEFMFCVNRHKRKFILFQCQDGARGGDPPVATPLDEIQASLMFCRSLINSVDQRRLFKML